jgi:uncharacterized protein YacL
MAKIYIYMIALISGGSIYYLDSSTKGLITGVISVVVISGIPFIIDIFKDKTARTSALVIAIGVTLASLAFGALSPVLRNFPDSVSWIIFGVLVSGISYIFYVYQRDIGFLFAPAGKKKTDVLVESRYNGQIAPKILDTSIVIDGRIMDLAATGFIEGPLKVPNFVLREIQLISDSADALKRNRGRRGLEMLSTLLKKGLIEVTYEDYTETREVDAKLVRLAKDLNGKLITNDFNLNKVAEIQDIEVLNINNLANALKPVVLPGEDMEVQVVKEGKDENQGIGYLDDGTMVVIENGGKMLGKKLKVNVTSVIQTNAGKMIFTKVVSKN